MRMRFDEQLSLLNTELLTMGALIERAISSASAALVLQDAQEANKAIAFEREVDQKEREIESLCLKLLRQQQPVARDLRLISAALKMITDMERIGDQAADISEIVLQLMGKKHIKELVHLPQMAKTAGRMVTGAIDAFVKNDVGIAHSVIKMDDEMDALFDVIREELVVLMSGDKSISGQAIDLLLIAKYFERIGDHAENIAEWAEFAMTGLYQGEVL